jgi:ribosomal protein S27E
MPVIYKGQCQNCQHESPVTSGGYAAIVLDEPTQHIGSHPDDPRIVILAHPLEMHILKELGFTFSSATLAGRWLNVNECFCKSCGNLYEVRKLGASGAVGCGPSLIAGSLCGVATGMLMHDALLGVFVGLMTVNVLAILLGQLAALFVSWRYRERAREFATPKRCPKCGSQQGISPGSRKAVVPCPMCGQTAMRIKAVGMS